MKLEPTDFDATPLGQAFIEAGEIREEIKSILEERRKILDEEAPPDPTGVVVEFGRLISSRFRTIAATE